MAARKIRKRRPTRPDLPYPFVFIQWEDHAGRSTASWKLAEQIVAEVGEEYLVWSAGWIVAESKKRITLCSNIHTPDGASSDEQVCGDMTIVRALIRKIIKA